MLTDSLAHDLLHTAHVPGWFTTRLLTMSRAQFLSHYHSQLADMAYCNTVLAFFDECSLDVQGKSIPCYIALMSHSLGIPYEAYQQIRLLQLGYKSIRKIQFSRQDDQDIGGGSEFVGLSIGLKKRALARINESFFQVMNSSLYLEVPRRHAEAILSKLRQMGLIDLQVK